MNGSIYLISSKNSNSVYIGRTSTSITKRWNEHNSAYNLFKDGAYRYYSVFDILSYGDCSISLLAECEKEKLSDMESHFIEKYKDTCINKNKILKGVDMVRCDCGKLMRNSQLNYHLNTKSHKIHQNNE
jgi:hypothetical protein